MAIEYERADWRDEIVTDFKKCCAEFAGQKSQILSSADSVLSTSVKILVTGTAADRRYITLLHDIALGKMLGPNTNMILICYGNKKTVPMLQDMVNELKDCILPLLKEVFVSSEEKEAFSGIHIAIMLDSQNNEKLTTVDKYAETFRTFKEYGQSFNYSGSNVKILVASEPPYLNAQILRRNCSAVQPNNIASLSMTLINVTKYHIAKKMDAPPDRIKNVIIWGDEPSKLSFDLNYSLIKVGDAWKNLPSVMANDHWIKNYLPELVKQRLSRASEDSGNFLALSKAICEQLRYWWFGVPDGEILRMGVESDGSYGITRGIYADFPVTISTSRVCSIVKDLDISPTTQIKLQALNEKLLMDIQVIQNWPMFQQSQLLA